MNPDTERTGPRLRLRLHAFAFLAVLGVWTWKLVEPNPEPEEIRAGLAAAGLTFTVHKSLHAIGYAILTMLAATLPVAQRWKYTFVGLIALHAVGTEIVQTFVPNRTGRWQDVLVDWFGITIGMAAVRVARWRKAASREHIVDGEPPAG